MPGKLLIAATLVTLAACVAGPPKEGYKMSTLVLPEGHPEAGRLAFVKLGCTSCHGVSWEKHFPEPVSTVPAHMS